MFTLEIDGTAIAVVNGDEATARDLFTCDGFKEDIRSLTSEGRPLWNGTSDLKVRAASQDEIDEFDEAVAADQDDDEGDFEPDPSHAAQADASDDEDEADIVFLVDIDDEDEDEGRLDA